MPLNLTEEERTEEANRQLAEKIRLEQPVIRDFRRLFKQMGKDLEAFFSLTGRIPNAEDYAEDIRAILLPHYKRTAASFGDSLLSFIKGSSSDEPIVQALSVIAEESDNSLDELISEMQARITIQTKEFISERVSSQVNLITGTNQEQLSRSISETISNIAQENRVAGANEVAAEASKEFVRVSTPRAETIASTTTQEASEGVKSIEHTVVTDTLVAAGFTELSLKAWATTELPNVRMAHQQANGQTQLVDQPFVVMGQLLMFPGDRSMGATASNTINCHCSSLLVVTSNPNRNSFNSGLRG